MTATRAARFLVAGFALVAFLASVPVSLASAEDADTPVSSDAPMADADEDGVFEPAPEPEPGVEGEADVTVEPVLENGPSSHAESGEAESSRGSGIGRLGVAAGVLLAGAAAVTAFMVLRRDRLVTSA